ncbi:MAG: 30S ribosomal protein S6 [Planctomycetes bacterium]|nr:30S ribosomal protein S6 [Planctomycetota bacterium]
MNQYEGMFLFDPTFGSSIENCETEVNRLMERADGEILFIGKWDERRLAYRINGRKRGVYMLVYFNAPPDKIAGMQRDAQISEDLLRLMVVRADGVSRDMMERQCAARGAERGPEEEAASQPSPDQAVAKTEGSGEAMAVARAAAPAAIAAAAPEATSTETTEPGPAESSENPA